MEFIINYWLEILFSLVSTGVLFIVRREIATKKGLQALLRNELIRCYREYETKKELTILDKENVESMYKQYRNLGGNGLVKKMYEDLLELPTKIIKE